jgi:hypothetical protein
MCNLLAITCAVDEYGDSRGKVCQPLAEREDFVRLSLY